MKLCVLGSTAGDSSFGLAASLAAIVGILARRSTLLVDFSDEPNRARQALRTYDPGGLEPLLDRYIRKRTFDPDDVRRQMIRYVPAAELNLGDQSFLHIIAGPAEITGGFLDRLAAQRGAGFVRLLIERCENLRIDTTIVEMGHTLDTLRGEALIGEADMVLLCQDEEISINEWAVKRRRQPPLKPQAWFDIAPETDFAFPDGRFVESLVSSSRAYENAVSRIALEYAELLHPSIRAELKDGDGHRLHPHRSLWQELFG